MYSERSNKKDICLHTTFYWQFRLFCPLIHISRAVVPFEAFLALRIIDTL
jgi:hypothetical protein